MSTTQPPQSRAAAAFDPEPFRRVFEGSFTWAAGFARNVHRYAGRTAVVDGPTGRSWTYAELGAVTGSLVGGLAARGVGRGDLVAHQLVNRPEFAMLYIAAQGLRAVSSPMNFRLAPAETAAILRSARPAVFVYEAASSADVRVALALSGWTPPTLVHVGEAADPIPGSIPFEDLLAADAPVFRAPEGASVYDETSRLYTSGTTGMPKAVPLTSLNEVLTAHDVIMQFPLGPTDRTMNTSPWFHRGGNYCGGPNTALYVGACVVTLPQFDAAVVLDAVEQRRLTHVVGAPTNLERLAEEQEAHPRDLSSLSGIVTMGAPLERAAALRYQRVLTPRIANGYGTTESFWNTYLRPEDLPDGAGTAGRACIDDDVAVVTVLADAVAAPADTVPKDGTTIGELAMRSVKSGYAYVGNPEEQAAKFHDGWLYPGDLATWDAEEVVTIVGRKDDMVISGGENVHPVQVEEVLAGHADVADSIVTGLPDPEWGELVVAYVRPRPGRLTDPQAAADELDRFCRESVSLARFKRPRRYAFVDDLPYTATGKKQHFVLKQRAPEDAAAGRFRTPGRG